MNLFENEYKKDLLRIDQLLEIEEDENTRKILLEDKNYILSYINVSNEIKDLQNGKKLNTKDIISFIKNNNLNMIKFKPVRIFNINYNKLHNLTNNFIENSNFNLSSEYLKIKSYNGIKFTENKSFHLGFTIYIKSLNKNYIHIDKKKCISDYSTLIHELGHAIGNKLCENSHNYYSEVYPIFLELVFCDFLKEHKMIRESYNIKISILKQLKNFINELDYELENYLYHNKNTNQDNYFFEYKFKTAKSIIIALHLYDMYLSNPQLTCLKTNEFLKHVGVLNEEQLLNLLGLDLSIFNSAKFISDISDQLNDERIKIMKPSGRIIQK